MNGMNMGWRSVAAAAALLGLLAAGRAADPAGPGDPAARRLVKQLGDPSYRLREEAQKKLIELGPPALDAVAAARASSDPEVSTRAKAIFKLISAEAGRRLTQAIRKNLLWQLSVPAGVNGRIRVVGGIVLYLGGPDRGGVPAPRLCAADARSGKRLWSFKTNRTSHWTASGDTVYVAGADDRLVALELLTGKAREGFEPLQVWEAPTVEKGVLYVVGPGGAMLAIDAATGATKWRADLPATAAFAPVVVGRTVCVLTLDGRVRAFDAAEGKLKWSAAVAGKGQSHTLGTLSSSGGLVILRAGGRLHVIHVATGKMMWAVALPGGAGGEGLPFIAVRPGRNKTGVALITAGRSVAVAGGAVHVMAGGKLLALDAKTGRKRWEYADRKSTDQARGAGQVMVLGGGNFQVRMVVGGVGGQRVVVSSTNLGKDWPSAPVAAGRAIYYGSGNGLHAIDAKTGRLLWTFATKNPVVARPAIAGGVIYFGTGSRFPAGIAALGRGRRGGLPAVKDKASQFRLFALKLQAPRGADRPE